MIRTALSCVVLSGVLIVFGTRAEAFKCNICHSKNPAMVRMHRATSEKEIGCFDCHKVGDKLMGKGRPAERGVLLQRRSAEPVCIECHQTDGRGERTALVPARPSWPGRLQ